LNWLCWIEYGLGDHEPSLEHAKQFLQAATTLGDARYTAQAHINLGRCHMVACDYGQAVEALERGLMMRARSAGASRAFALNNLAMVLGDRGDFEHAYARIEESERIGGGQLSLLGPLLVLRAMVENWQGQWDAAIRTSARANDIAQRIEGRYISSMSALLSGYSRFMATRDVSALEQTREGIDQLESLGIRLHMSCNWSLLASGLALAGSYDQAQAAAENALVRAGAFDRQGEVEALRVLALVGAVRDRQWARAESLLERAVKAANDKASERDLALCDLTWSRVRQTHGDHSGAAAALANARRRARRIGMTLPQAAGEHAGAVEDER
jgi:tetratricopeptide (TPR) repeat protein